MFCMHYSYLLFGICILIHCTQLVAMGSRSQPGNFLISFFLNIFFNKIVISYLLIVIQLFSLTNLRL